MCVFSPFLFFFGFRGWFSARELMLAGCLVRFFDRVSRKKNREIWVLDEVGTSFLSTFRSVMVISKPRSIRGNFLRCNIEES